MQRWWIFAVIALIVLGWFPLLGMPGIIPLYLGYPIYEIFMGSGSFERSSTTLGDNTWPMLLVLSTIWPTLLPVSWLIAGRCYNSPEKKRGRLALFLAVFLLALSLLGFIGLLMFRRE